MTEVKRSTDSNGSPRHELLQDLAIAIACAEATTLSRLVTHDVRLLRVGSSPISGADLVCAALTRYGPATQLVIDHITADAQSGALDGTVGFGRKERAFCLMITFGNAKGTVVRAITSYSIPLR